MKKEELEKARHSLAHLLASAVLDLYPDTLVTLGPAIDTGFYYDFEFKTPVSEKDFEKIEKKMRETAKQWKGFEESVISFEEAKKLFAGNPYKLELIEEINNKGEKITTQKSGNFVDLCRGGHVDDMSRVPPDSWKLDRVAGAYWRGDEKNKMLTRIYGLAFETKEALDAYVLQQEEAKKRDHRLIGKDLGLFVFSELVGKGLPLFTEKGSIIRRELERFIVDEEIKRGYMHVYTPEMAKVELYKTSGHYPYYKDTMYPVMKIDEEELILRPMTCPHHFQLYASEPHTYKELPIRIAELAKQFRYEKSGELTGLMRVRSFCLADAHIICKKDQAVSEINGVLDLIEYASSVFGLKKGENYRYRLSLGDRTETKKYYKDDEAWDFAENVLRSVLKERKAPFYEGAGEAAFYGPKIDIQMKNFAGKEDTAFTVQYDFVMPKRFSLTYIDETGKKQEPIVVHRSSIGAIERVMAFLIEHYAGNFPLWLSPVQVKVIPVRTNHNEYAKEVYNLLHEKNIRVVLDDDDKNLGGKVRDAKNQKMPYWIVIGDKEIEAGKVTLESRDSGQLGQISKEELVSKLLEEIKNKSAH